MMYYFCMLVKVLMSRLYHQSFKTVGHSWEGYWLHPHFLVVRASRYFYRFPLLATGLSFVDVPRLTRFYLRNYCLRKTWSTHDGARYWFVVVVMLMPGGMFISIPSYEFDDMMLNLLVIVILVTQCIVQSHPIQLFV